MSHQLLLSAINHYWEIFAMEIMDMIGIVKVEMSAGDQM